MLTQDKITEIFCITDDFCKAFAQEIKKLRNRDATGHDKIDA